MDPEANQPAPVTGWGELPRSHGGGVAAASAAGAEPKFGASPAAGPAIPRIAPDFSNPPPPPNRPMAPLRTLSLFAAMAALGLASCSDNDRNPSTAGATPTITGSLQGLGLNTLAAALQAAGLDDDLAGSTQLTLFAPSDAAFAALPPGTVDSLLQPANRQQLIDILRYHVVAGAVPSSTARTLTSADTLLS